MPRQFPSPNDMAASALGIFPDRVAVADFSAPYFYERPSPEPPYGNVYYGFAFPKGSPLCAQVNQGLAQAVNDGTYAIIYEKWFGVAPTFIP